jgi:GNAT superfamily N-acetyltransferase
MRDAAMKIDLRDETLAALSEHAAIPIAFRVERVLLVSKEKDAASGYIFTERTLDVPYLKDYDAIAGEGPTLWAERFDMSNWGLISAHAEDRRIGGAVIAFNTPSADMLEGRTDLAILWDLRVHPEFRGRGTGSELFRAAEKWAMARGCRELKVETQNINVAACKFYARQGCVLEAVNCFAYEKYPDEIQLLWQKRLGSSATLGD